MYLWPSQSPTALGVDCNHLYINIPFQASQIDTFACSIIHVYIGRWESAPTISASSTGHDCEGDDLIAIVQTQIHRPFLTM